MKEISLFQLTNHDEDGTEELDAGANQSCEEAGIAWGAEHIAVYELPACLLQSLILSTETDGDLISTGRNGTFVI